MFDGVSTDTDLVGVPAENFERWYHRVSPHIEKMAEGSGGRFYAEDICAGIVDREMQLWVILDGPNLLCVFVTSVVVYPRLKALRFMGCVGRNFRKWVHHRASVEAWGRSQGASLAEAWVPHAKWLTIFQGYELDHMMLVKEI